MTAHFTASFITLSITGIATAGYLIWQHSRKKPLVCPLDHDCSTVTESKYSRMLGVRNEALGLGYYLAMLLGMAATFVLPEYAELIRTTVLVASAIAVLFSAYLVYLQLKVIKDYCFYCLISALVTVLLFLNSLALG